MDGRLCRRRIVLEKISLRKKDLEVLLKHAKDCEPNEACAVLYGKSEDKESKVSEIRLAKNIDQSPVNFTIAPEELIDIYKEAEKKGLEIVGIFHSHPSSSAIPSGTDQRFMALNPTVWVISSGVEKNVFAYKLDSKIEKVEINLI